MSELDISKCTDWRINTLDSSQSVIFPGPFRVVGQSALHAAKMAAEIKKALSDSVEGSRCLLEFEGFKYRVQRVREDLYAARTLHQVPLRLSDLALPQYCQDFLTDESYRRRGGLIIIFGAAGAGKTTTAAATILARVEKHGGFCLCVEDPPENNLAGFHGERGYIEQMDASVIGYEAALIEALRCFPAGESAMLFLGEIRSKSEAFEAMQASLDGHLVITTMHSKDIVSGLSRLASLAGANGEKDTRMMLASGLVLAVHQTNSNNTRRLTALKFSQTSTAIVQNGSFYQLQDEILKQNKQHGRP